MLSRNELEAAVARLHDCQFYPGESATLDADLLQTLSSMVGTSAQLKWLIDTYVRQVGRWTNLHELRGIYCNRYRPADGIEAECSETPGFTPDEQEMRYIASRDEDRKRHEQIQTAPVKQLFGEVQQALNGNASEELDRLIEDSKPQWKKREEAEERKRSPFLNPAPPIDKKEITQADVDHALAIHRLTNPAQTEPL